MSPYTGQQPTPPAAAPEVSGPPEGRSVTGTVDRREACGARSAPPGTVSSSIPWTCLVLSHDRNRRSSLADAAELGGWRPVEAESVGEALRASERWQTQLAMVDLGTMQEKQKQMFRQFGAAYAKQRGSLLVLCEQDQLPAGELLARQAGVWLYLPDADLSDGLVELYREAIQVAEKLGQRSRSAAVSP